MGLRNLLRQMKRREERTAPKGFPMGSRLSPGAAPVATEGPKMTLSQETLNELIKGRDSLLQKRQELVQQLQQVDAYLQQQQGGIETMQRLLAGQEEAIPK